jgi:two-component system phosphate regulon sensor histidine kinase PhoR
MNYKDRYLFILPFFAFFLTCFFVALLFWQLTAFEDGIRQETSASITHETELVGKILQPLLLDGKLQEARKFCNSFDKDSLRLTLIDRNGDVEADSAREAIELGNHLERQEVRNALAGKPESVTRFSESLKLWMTYYAIALELPDRTFILRSAISTDKTSRLIRLGRHMCWLSLLLGAVMVLILTFYIINLIRRPLRALQRSLCKIADGELDVEIPVPARGMVRPIAMNVKEMSDQLREQLKQLRKLESFRRDFLSDVSHEIKTPLTCIVVAAETMQETSNLPQVQIEKLISIMHLQALRLNSLVQDILTLSSLEHCQQEQRKDFLPCSLNEVLRHVAEEYREIAEKAKCKIKVEDIRPPVEILADMQLLEHALGNVVRNALKYSGSCTVELKIVKSDNEISMFCIDHGCGIKKENQARIFERFYRVNKERSRELGGTGLGLAIVKHIMKLHNGNAEMLDTPGGGSTFKLTLPLKADLQA